MTITQLNQFHQYFTQVVGKADHHAPRVTDVVLPIAGAIILKADSVKVMTREGEMKNALWFNVADKRYAISYVHDKGIIELRDGSLHGNVIHAFDNNTTSSTIRQVFSTL